MTHPQMQNRRDEWVTAIPEPFRGWWIRCSCGARFHTTERYRQHYALYHIVFGEKPL